MNELPLDLKNHNKYPELGPCKAVDPSVRATGAYCFYCQHFVPAPLFYPEYPPWYPSICLLLLEGPNSSTVLLSHIFHGVLCAVAYKDAMNKERKAIWMIKLSNLI